MLIQHIYAEEVHLIGALTDAYSERGTEDHACLVILGLYSTRGIAP
jgi:hypothetical protein